MYARTLTSAKVALICSYINVRVHEPRTYEVQTETRVFVYIDMQLRWLASLREGIFTQLVIRRAPPYLCC